MMLFKSIYRVTNSTAPPNKPSRATMMVSDKGIRSFLVLICGSFLRKLRAVEVGQKVLHFKIFLPI